MNGWTNYETWKVNLEVFDGWDGGYLSPVEATEIASAWYLEGLECNPSAHSIVCYFLDQVNWHEIAEAHSEN